MIRRKTHEILWLAVKIVLVVGAARITGSALQWVGLGAILIFLTSCLENASGRRFTKSRLDEAVDDRLWSESRRVKPPAP